MLCNNCVITSITWCITCSTPYYMHYMLFYMRITCSIIQHNPITCSITCHLHDQLHAITCSTVLLHAPLHANYMINYMLDYMQHHSITCSITWQLHNQLHDLLHTQLPTITCIELHEISWAHDHVFLVQPSTPKKPPSLSASGAQDSRRRLRQLMRGLLERILLSCPKHENTGLESVRIIKALCLWSTSTGWIQTIEKNKKWRFHVFIAKWDMGGAIPAHCEMKHGRSNFSPFAKAQAITIQVDKSAHLIWHHKGRTTLLAALQWSDNGNQQKQIRGYIKQK